MTALRAPTPGFRRCITRCAHPPKVELAALGVLYLLYQLGRGVVGDAFADARARARAIAEAERSLGVAWERGLQAATASVPGLETVLAVSYVSLHVGATTAALIWLYRRRPSSYAVARTTLILGTAFALAIHVAFPTAPPRLAGVGIADTVATAAHVDLGSELLGPLYNPIAAVPSMHFGYALVVGFFVLTTSRRLVLRAVGATYPAFVLFVIVATGNHFVFDAVAGAAVIAAAAGVVRLSRSRQRRRPRQDAVARLAANGWW